jgi:decaprenyl-phosphate phosphoribosyltransferase
MPWALVRAMRPHQWVKNLFVLAPLVFAKELFDGHTALRAATAFASFCLLASSVYLLNDLQDIEADRAHPVKRHRPIASGHLAPRIAWLAAAACLALACVASIWLGPGFGLCALAYLVLNVAYSFRLKRVAYVDVLCIATGFELRVLAGAYAAAVQPSAYLLAVTFLLAAFLGLGKRMHELSQNPNEYERRPVLKAYDRATLALLLSGTAGATLATYVIYTLDAQTRRYFGTDYLVVTALFTVFGILRFIHLIRARPDAESPTEEMLRDPPFLANLGLWAMTTLAIIYWS